MMVTPPRCNRALVGLFVTGAVAITAAAGLAFWWFRIKGRGIWAPVAFHAGVNSLSLVVAAIAHRQLG
jgi:membrane protease YdiL (CAAX protease family)